MSVDKPSIIAIVFIAFWALALATGVTSADGWITNSQGVAVDGDYMGVYTAGKFTLQGEPLAAYDWVRHERAQHELDGNPNGAFFLWPYPPSFLFVAASLALLPYFLSMLTWTLATFAAFTAAIARISASRRDLLLMLATPAAWLNLYIGQNGSLTAALIGFGLVLLPARPVAAGICIGLLSVKPHLGLLIPVALLAGGYYRAFASAALTVVALALVTTVAFGIDVAARSPTSYAHRDACQDHDIDDKNSKRFRTGAQPRLIGVSRALAARRPRRGARFAIAWLWSRRDVGFDLKAAALAAAITLASPYQFVYDLVILTIAQAFLLRRCARAGTDAVETYGLIVANVLVLLFVSTPVPLGVVACAVVMGLVWRRVWLDRRAGQSRNPCPASALPFAGA